MSSNLVIIWLLLCILSLQRALAGNTTYVLALLGQDIHSDTINTDITYELVITNNETASVTVTITGSAGLIETLVVEDKTVHELDQQKGLNGSEYSNKSLIVQSQDGFFTLQVFTKRQDHNYVEGFLGIPLEALTGPHQPSGQTVYNHVVATFCDIGGYCQLAVAAFDDDTTVSVILPKNVESIAVCKGKGFFRTERDTSITLSKYDALQLETTYDLTGTVIYSFKPIAVFVGSRNVTNGDIVAHTMEQLVPSSHWGTEYIVQNLGTNGYGDILKIVSHWSNTKVTMKGFPPFTMKDWYQTAVRRLDKGFSSHIKATHPIQVVQITGLTYATENETSSLSMTVVPSVQNAHTEPITVACHGETQVNAKFYLVEEKLNGETKVDGQTISVDNKIKYSNYKTGMTEKSNTLFTIEGTAVRGIMKCETATMPLSVLFNENVSGTTKLEPAYNGGNCYEGGKASTKFDITSSTATPYSLDLQEYREHIIEMRVRACGEAVLQFIMKSGDIHNSLLLMVTHKQIIVQRCMPNCSSGASAIVPDSNNFHNSASANWDCRADMAYVWFRQIFENSKVYFCFGLGVYDDSVCQNADTDTYFEIPDEFRVVKMRGLASDAAFIWDFIHIQGCDFYESDWRCADRFTNCSMYGTHFCTDENFSNFAHVKCAKFCGKCFADSYGRKFIIKIPPFSVVQGSCKIIVSPLNKLTNVGVTYTDVVSSKTYVVHGSIYENGERYYDCYDAMKLMKQYGLSLHTITSDDNVAVTVIIKIEDELKSYRIYPVDTYGTEYLLLEYGTDEEKECTFTSEFEDVHYIPYYSMNSHSTSKQDAERSALILMSRLRSNGFNEISGSLIVFDKPSAVFCGDRFTKVHDMNYYHHILPTVSWSTEYVIPAFDEATINRPFEAKLLIISNADNTIVNISGGFDAVHAIYNRGDLLTQDIDAGCVYHINASQTIGVGLYLFDPENTHKFSFHILPPSRNFHDTVVTSAPIKVLETDGFSVTDIKTYFVNQRLTTSQISTPASDADGFYRHVRQGDAVFEMTVVKSDNDKWFVIPGNVKSQVQHMVEQICNMSTQGVNDGLDNDCDGLTDEDVCYNTYGVYRIDKDFDGGFGEDCNETFTDPVVVSKPIDPACIEIKKPPGQCWTACTCKCSWVEKYEAQKNMSKEELEEAQQDDIQQIQSVLQIDTESLPSTTAKKVSADDKRQSAASIGYVGIALFALVFGTILIMDITSLLRDARILLANLKEGFERLSDCFKRNS